jgi:dTDP-4-amino-4,6-dideoxygalactose transaminase
MIKRIINPFFFDLSIVEKKKLFTDFNNIIKSGELILGDYTDSFEKKFAKLIGTKYAISLNSGTTALEILINYRTKLNKTLIAVQTNTNFATTASIIRANGSPVYLDMSYKYLSPTYEEVKKKFKTYRFEGLVWVHIAGIISPDFIKVVSFCKRNRIFLIEDCAHAHGSKLNNKFAGSFAQGGAFSFFPTKIMTTMEGGMITTNDTRLRNFAISMRNQGKGLQKYGCYHIDLGNSWRMLEISSALGLIQLKKLSSIIKKRNNIYKIYKKTLQKTNIKHSDSSHMQQASNYKFIIYGESIQHASDVKAKLKKFGIICGGGVYERPCHLQPVFKKFNKFAKNLKISEKFCPLQICLPIHSNMSESDSYYSISKLIDVY